MNWYTAESRKLGVREVVLEVPDPQPIESKFGMLMLGDANHILRANVWTTGFFRLESDPGFCDLVITDLTMPQITGLQLADHLEQIRPGLPVLLITGMTDQKAIDISSHPNILGLIRKPFGGDALRLAVDRALEEAERRKES